MEKELAPQVDVIEKDNESSEEKISNEKELLDLLNKARQGGVEYGDIYAHVFGDPTKSEIKYPSFLVKREDLIEKFAVGVGKPYRSTQQAAHDLVEYLAEEAEDVIHEFEEKAEIERINKEISSEKDFLAQINNAKQTQTENSDIYNHVFGGKSTSGTKYPEFLINNPDLLKKFAVGENGEPYTSTSEAAHDLVEYLAEEAEDVVRDLEEQLKKFDKKEEKTTTETKATSPNKTEAKPTIETATEIPTNLETGIPMMITKKLRKQLNDFGVSDGEINKLTPKKAWELLKEKAEKTPVSPTPTESTPVTPTPDENSEDKPEPGTSPENEKTEAPNTEKVEDRAGILRSINKFLSKYPKLLRLALAAELVVALSRDIGNGGKIEMPVVNHAYTHNEFAPDREGEAAEIGKELPQYVLTQIQNLESVKDSKERDEITKIPGDVRIERFENFKLSQEDIRQIIEETLPRGFSRNLSSIKFIEREPNQNKEYQLSADNPIGKIAGSANRYYRSIEIYKTTNDDSKEWIANDLIPHEVFHLQDWSANRMFNQNERLDLLKKIVDRVKSPDRFKSDYVEGITNPDKKLELDIKTTEYFAEIGATYLSAEYDLLPGADKEIIRNFIAQVDPTFDRVAALKKRDQIIKFELPVWGIEKTDKVLEEEARKSGEESWQRLMIPMFTREYAPGALSPAELEKEHTSWIESEIQSWKEIHDNSVKKQKAENEIKLQNRYKN